MGLFSIGCRVENTARTKSAALKKLLVDTGSEATWINAKALEEIGVKPVKKDVAFQMANGQLISRSIGYAILKVDRSETVDEVVFAQTGDLNLLGTRALEGLNLHVDSRSKRLVAAGPILAAGNRKWRILT